MIDWKNEKMSFFEPYLDRICENQKENGLLGVDYGSFLVGADDEIGLN